MKSKYEDSSVLIYETIINLKVFDGIDLQLIIKILTYRDGPHDSHITIHG